MRDATAVLLLATVTALPLSAQHPATRIIPKIEQVTPRAGSWRVGDTLVIVATGSLSRTEAQRFAPLHGEPREDHGEVTDDMCALPLEIWALSPWRLA